MRRRILIVDDHPTNVAVLQELLEDEYELETASSGEECLEKVREFGPDVILLDLMMPGIDGYETCRRIKSAPYGELSQVVLVSAKATAESRVEGYKAGADDYIIKPFDHDELLAKVRVQFRMRDTLLELAGARGELTVQNLKLEEIVRRRTAEIVETRDVAMFALAKLAESRDPETGEHLERMRSYSQILAEHLAQGGPYRDQIDEEFLENLYRSSPLHDIGKVGIPDAILLKPGRLTESEFEVMKRHTIIGAETMSQAARHTDSGGFLQMGASIALGHHERFDGAGYPQGLAGQDIPLEARIVALADVYDALTSARVYKAAFEPEKARGMIVEQTGRQFDSIIVEVFLACQDEFLAIVEKHTHPVLELVASGEAAR